MDCVVLRQARMSDKSYSKAFIFSVTFLKYIELDRLSGVEVVCIHIYNMCFLLLAHRILLPSHSQELVKQPRLFWRCSVMWIPVENILRLVFIYLHREHFQCLLW